MDYASYPHWLYGKRGNDLLSLQRTTPKESRHSKNCEVRKCVVCESKLVMCSQLIDTQFLFVNLQRLRAALLVLKGAAF